MDARVAYAVDFKGYTGGRHRGASERCHRLAVDIGQLAGDVGGGVGGEEDRVRSGQKYGIPAYTARYA